MLDSLNDCHYTVEEAWPPSCLMMVGAALDDALFLDCPPVLSLLSEVAFDFFAACIFIIVMTANAKDPLTANHENQQKAHDACCTLHELFVLSARMVVQIMLTNQKIHMNMNIVSSAIANTLASCCCCATVLTVWSPEIIKNDIRSVEQSSSPIMDVKRAILIYPCGLLRAYTHEDTVRNSLISQETHVSHWSITAAEVPRTIRENAICTA